MSYLLDTNVLSETIRNTPDAAVIRWLRQVPDDHLYVSVLSLGEMRKGIERMPPGTGADLFRFCRLLVALSRKSGQIPPRQTHRLLFGDLILIDRRDCVDFSDDAIYVFNLDGEVFVKRIQRIGRGQIEILSDNPKYKTRRPRGHELETLRIIGRVVWAGGRV